MRISDLIKMGLKNLARRKARTILTVLGVIIGSLSIIIMVSIGNGMNNNFNSQLMESGGLTTIYIYKNASIWDDEGSWVGSKEQKLDDALVEKIKQIEHVRAVTPVIETFANLQSGKYYGYTWLIAMDYSVFDDFDFPGLAFGEYPSEEDNSWIVAGVNAIRFYDPNYRGRYGGDVKVDLQKDKIELQFTEYTTDFTKKPFKVQLSKIGQFEQTNGNYDYNSYIDMQYFKQLWLKYCNTLKLEERKRAIKVITEYQQIMLNVDNVKNVLDVQDIIENELGVMTQSQMQWIEPLQESSKTMQMVLGALGAVAMVVSAISIANTMIMSIYERTREIGIMKVLGCVIRDIRRLFLFEAAIIGMIGGIVGIILGYVASWAINKYGAPIFGSIMSTSYMYDMTNTKFSIIPIYLPFVSLLISVTVGVLSGYFPARRATKIKAIEAMKTE